MGEGQRNSEAVDGAEAGHEPAEQPGSPLRPTWLVSCCNELSTVYK
jgi:hypothetical protein